MKQQHQENNYQMEMGTILGYTLIQMASLESAHKRNILSMHLLKMMQLGYQAEQQGNDQLVNQVLLDIILLRANWNIMIADSN